MIQVICNRASTSARDLQKLLSKEKGDLRVNWTGSPLPDSLNGKAFTDKARQAVRLGIAGVPTIQISLRKEGKDWLPRRANHQQGFDFTNKKFLRGLLGPPDFYVKKEDLVDEYRIHVFKTKNDNMRVLRVARRVPSRPDHHPWVRSHRLGWKLSYVGGASDRAKQIARDSVRALHLDFGAVDIGIKASGDPIVLEVNTCPGLEGNTLAFYARSIVERV